MPGWLLEGANNMPAWVLVIGIVVNAVIAFVAVKSVLPRGQKMAAYLVHDEERSEYTASGFTAPVTRTTHIWSVGIKNLGPNDVVDVRICDVSKRSRWWGAFPYVFYPTIRRQAQIADWEASYIPVDGDARIYLDLRRTGADAEKSLIEDGGPLLEKLRVEYKTLDGRIKKIWLPISFSAVRKYLHRPSSQ